MNNAHQSREVSRVLFDILAYLADNPEADDTIEGITQWWLLEQKIRRQIPVVEKALTELVKKGFVLARGGNNGRIHYRVNRSKQKQIKAFLDREEDGPNGNSDTEHI